MVFHSFVDGNSSDGALCEESFRVLVASDARDARAKAMALGQASEHDYVNDQDELVRWCFSDVAELQELGPIEIRDGTEIFSRVFQRGGAPSLATEARRYGLN